MRLAIVLASLSIAACFPPRPASERPLSYRAPVPGWVRHDVDSTLSLLLPPELQRQPRADTAFAPVLFLSDSARVTVRLGMDAAGFFSDQKRPRAGLDRAGIRNGNPGRYAWFIPEDDELAFGLAGYFSSWDTRDGFFPIGDPLPGAERFDYPRVLLIAEATDSLVVDRVFDYVRLTFSP